MSKNIFFIFSTIFIVQSIQCSKQNEKTNLVPSTFFSKNVLLQQQQWLRQQHAQQWEQWQLQERQQQEQLLQEQQQQYQQRQQLLRQQWEQQEHQLCKNNQWEQLCQLRKQWEQLRKLHEQQWEQWQRQQRQQQEQQKWPSYLVFCKSNYNLNQITSEVRWKLLPNFIKLQQPQQHPLDTTTKDGKYEWKNEKWEWPISPLLFGVFSGINQYPSDGFKPLIISRTSKS